MFYNKEGDILRVFTYKDYLIFKHVFPFHSMLCDRTETYQVEGHQIYDKTYKTILSSKEHAVQLINKVLSIKNTPFALKAEDIERYKSSFITENFKIQESDIVYKKKDESIFFLIEHQSKVDYSMPYRILNYSVEIIRSAVDEEKLKRKDCKIAGVYPIVLYTGNKKWNVRKYLEECQVKLQGVFQKPFAFYYLVDMNEYTETELDTDNTFLSNILLMEKLQTKEEKIHCLEKMIQSKLKNEEKVMLRQIIQYMLPSKIGKDIANDLIIRLNEKRGDDEMSALEEILSDMIDEKIELVKRRKLEEFREKGLSEGREEGIQAGRKVGLQEGIREGKKVGLQEGIREGKKVGLQEGIKEGKKVGLQEGIKEGKKQGKKEILKKIVRKMLENGMTDDRIILMTELTKRELYEMKEEITDESVHLNGD